MRSVSTSSAGDEGWDPGPSLLRGDRVPWLIGSLFVLITCWALLWSVKTYWNPLFFFGLWASATVLVRTLQGEAPLPLPRQLLLMVLSVPLWWWFEFVNGSAQNWKYQEAFQYTPTEYILFASLTFSTVVPALEPGARLWVDGPFGAFTPEQRAAQGYVLIAGGIGISPMRSIITTLRDREDVRPVLLFYAARDASRLAFREEIERLRGQMNLEVVYVFESPGPEWSGERGYVSADVLRRHLPRQYRHFQFFVCGPVPMMDAVEKALRELGVPAGAVQTERFDMV